LNVVERDVKTVAGARDAVAAPPPLSRRDVLLRLGIVLNVVAAALFALPVVGFLFGPVKRMIEQAWIPLGWVKDFPEHATRLATYQNPFTKPWDGRTAVIPCWVRRLAGDAFQVFAINCTHLGCPVRWFEQSQLFMCPCHGGVFYSDGTCASGPPPRALYRYDVKIDGGRVWVRGGQIPTLSEPV
jgi:menaquinol-cytochrome c reductase iron-sulfur subunit